MSSSESSNASNARITKLGLQLGIFAALEQTRSAPKKKNKKKKKEKAEAPVANPVRPVIDAQQWNTHQDNMEKVNKNLKEINTRLSVFDSYLIPAAATGESCAGALVTSTEHGRSSAFGTSPPGAASAPSEALQRSSPRSRSPMAVRDVPEKASSESSTRASISAAATAAAAARKAELRVSSPQRARHQAVLYNQPYEGRAPPPMTHTYQIRVSFWSDEELKRMQSYSPSPLRYGMEPSFIDLLVPESANPRDMLVAVLNHWQWDSLHAFRFVGASAGASGRTGTCYEGKAYLPDPAAPALNKFGLYTGAQCLLIYDLSGDNWRWLCTCLKVHVISDIRTTPLSQRVTLVGQQGVLPAQYLWQFEKRFANVYCSKLNDIEDVGHTKSDGKRTEVAGREGEGVPVPERKEDAPVEQMASYGYDKSGKYFGTTLAKVVQIYIERYKPRSIEDIEELHQERLARAGGQEGLLF